MSAEGKNLKALSCTSSGSEVKMRLKVGGKKTIRNEESIGDGRGKSIHYHYHALN